MASGGYYEHYGDRYEERDVSFVYYDEKTCLPYVLEGCESCEYSSSSSSESDEEWTQPSANPYVIASPDSMAELEIPVWVGRCEKWVTGLTRRTTCDDVIYALMSHDGGDCDAMDLQSYVMYERWKEVERALKGRTKIMKVWRAWGSECRNVKFFLKKVENPYESGSEIMKPRRIRRHGHSGSSQNVRSAQNSKRHDEQEYQYRKQERSRRRTLQEREERRRQRHMSRSMEHIWDDFDMAEKNALPSSALYPEEVSQSYNIPPGPPPPLPPHSSVPVAPPEDNTKNRFFNELVQLILTQEKRLQDQLQRLKDTDGEIDVCETKVHINRIELNGRNYVQDAYMRDRSLSEESSGTSADEMRMTPLSREDERDIDIYMEICENITRLQQKISDQENKIEDLTMDIFTEIQADNTDNYSLASGYEGSPGKSRSGRQTLDTIHECEEPESSQLFSEIAKLRKEIERSISLSLAQQKQLELVEDTLGQCETQIQRKTLYVNQLALELREEDELDVVRAKPHRPQTLSRLKSKSCEMLSRAPLMPPLEEEVYHTDDFLYKHSDSRPHYNSDSGVESVDNKLEADNSDKNDLSLSPKSDQGFVDDVQFAITSSGRKMVPYFTYALDKDCHGIENKQYSAPGKSNVSEDSNSDTGLSSLHSDEPSPILETLV